LIAQSTALALQVKTLKFSLSAITARNSAALQLKAYLVTLGKEIKKAILVYNLVTEEWKEENTPGSLNPHNQGQLQPLPGGSNTDLTTGSLEIELLTETTKLEVEVENLLQERNSKLEELTEAREALRKVCTHSWETCLGYHTRFRYCTKCGTQ
jgi:hypothetical protein